MTFHIANSVDEAKTSTLYVEMDDRICTSLYKYREEMPEEIELLISLDPYGDKVLRMEEVSILVNLADWLRTSARSVELKNFGEELWTLCKRAIALEKSIVVLGD